MSLELVARPPSSSMARVVETVEMAAWALPPSQRRRTAVARCHHRQLGSTGEPQKLAVLGSRPQVSYPWHWLAVLSGLMALMAFWNNPWPTSSQAASKVEQAMVVAGELPQQAPSMWTTSRVVQAIVVGRELPQQAPSMWTLALSTSKR